VTRRLVLSYLAIVAVVLAVLEIPLGVNYARREREALVTNLERDAVVVAGLVEDQLQGGVRPVRADLDAYVASTGIRVVVTDADGISVLDTDDDFAVDRDYSTRPEIDAALRGRRAEGLRPSRTLGQDLVYVAVPVASGGTVHGAVRITYPGAEVDARVARNWLLLTGVAVGVLATTTVVGVMLARWVTGPTRELGDVVADVAAGHLDRRASVDAGPPEIRELARRVNDMAERLEELIQSQRAFVADASHQLRSPLTALRLELENLADDPPGHVEAAGLERAVDETRRLRRILDGLLLLTRAEGGRPDLTTVAVDAVVADRVQAWVPVAEEHGVTLDVEATGPIAARAVDGHLDQVLDNLVDNAIEATPSGGGVRVRVARRDLHVEVTVADDGPGMDDDELAHAFDRFWRASTARPGSGSGLGLSIARQLARSSGGDLVLGRAPGGGLLARVTLRTAP
jgi:signal transduction histidine kinase